MSDPQNEANSSNDRPKEQEKTAHGTENSTHSAETSESSEAPSEMNGNGEAPSETDALKEAENKYLYLYAEFENFKKRTEKERSDLRKFGWTPIARDLLEVLDNLGRAIDHAKKSSDKAVLKGLQMVQQEFEKSLTKHGVKRVNSLNKDFDPNFHEAVGNVPSPDHAEGKVMHEDRAGYMLHERLLRPSRVLVSSGTPEGTDQKDDQ